MTDTPGGRRPRHQTYSFVIGAVVGMLVIGLALPFAIDTKREDRNVRSGAMGSTAATGGVGNEAPAGGPGATVATRNLPRGTPASATGGASGTAPTRTTGSAGASATSLRATDEGVSASSIKLGLVLLDIGGASKLGVSTAGLDERQQQAAWQAFVDEINEAGGINGRRLEPVYDSFDTFNSEDQRSTCLHFTEDEQVFAVLGGFVDPSVNLCVTQAHETPLMAYVNAPRSQFAASNGLLFTFPMASDRLMANWVAELDTLGALRGKKIGVLGDDQSDPGGEVAGDLVQHLARAGHGVAARAHFAADQSTAASQMPVAVQTMRAARVDVIFMVTEGFTRGTLFVQTADSQGYRPKYFTSDWAGNNFDTTWDNAPASFDGSIGITSTFNSLWAVPGPERPVESACREIYERRTGRTLHSRADDAHVEYSVTMALCSLTDVFAKAARSAGPDLTRTRLSEGLRGLGSLLFAQSADGSFGPSKFDAADTHRTHAWSVSAKRFKPVGGFRRASH